MWKTFIMQILVILILSKNISIMQNLYSLWEKIILVVAKDIPKAKILTWFRNSAILACDEKTATIGLSREFYLSFHEKNTRRFIEEAFRQEFSGFEKIDFVIDGALENEKSGLTVDLFNLFPKSQV